MIRRELMVIKVVPLRCVFATDIDDSDTCIRKIRLRGFSPHNGHAVNGRQETTRKEFIFMSTAGMSENKLKRHRGKFCEGAALRFKPRPYKGPQQGRVIAQRSSRKSDMLGKRVKRSRQTAEQESPTL
jgi:hypothetical protein